MTILSQAETIRDETTAGANTAERVGDCLVDIAERLEAPAIGQVTMTGNATITDCTNTTDFFKIAGTTAAGAMNNGFTAANNRLTYTGQTNRKVIVHTIATVFCDHGNHVIELGLYNSSDAAVEVASVGRVMIQAGVNKATQVCTSTVMELATGDYVESHIRGVESAEDYTVSNLNMLITEA